MLNCCIVVSDFLTLVKYNNLNLGVFFAIFRILQVFKFSKISSTLYNLVLYTWLKILTTSTNSALIKEALSTIQFNVEIWRGTSEL